MKNQRLLLIKEVYDKSKYENKFPFYEYFYYIDYLDKDYIGNILKNKDDSKYPVLIKYLQNKRQKKPKDKDKFKDNYSLDNLNLFNAVLKLFDDKYSNQRIEAERQTIKACEIYVEKNAELIITIFDFENFETNFK